jgi:hypothetical protein
MALMVNFPCFPLIASTWELVYRVTRGWLAARSNKGQMRSMSWEEALETLSVEVAKPSEVEGVINETSTPISARLRAVCAAPTSPPITATLLAISALAPISVL